MPRHAYCVCLFFFDDAATPELYTLSLHDALPISALKRLLTVLAPIHCCRLGERNRLPLSDRKSTRLNSSHGYISYAVFCLKKKNRLPIPRTAEAGCPRA